MSARLGNFMARGIQGQYLCIDPQRDVVIVATAAEWSFRNPGVNDGNAAAFRRIAAAAEELDGTG